MPTVFRAVLRRFNDVPKAMAFYRDGLGIEFGVHVEGELYEFPFANGMVWEVCAGGPGPTPPVTDRKRATDCPIFDVDDVHATVEKLVSLGGAVINAPFDLPRRRLAYVADPEGHIIGLGMDINKGG
jgi:predicted enzyme related to lactoylglutathione lyase